MKLMVATAALALLTTAALAQGPGQRPGGGGPPGGFGGGRPGGMMGGGGMGGGRGMNRLFEQLNLNDGQKAKLKTIQDDARKKREALDKETMDKVKKVLTPEQAKKLEDLRKQMMSRGPGGMMGGGFGGPGGGRPGGPPGGRP